MQAFFELLNSPSLILQNEVNEIFNNYRMRIK